MCPRRTGRKPWVVEVLLVVGLIGSGCQSTNPIPSLLSRAGLPTPPSRPAPDSAVPVARSPIVQPGTELSWEIQTNQDRPDLVRSGHGIVGPDGTMAIGPYGTCRVAGLTLEQAKANLERQLSSWVKNPIVRVSAMIPEAPREIAWRPAGSPAPEGNTALAAFRPDDPIRPIGFQKDAGPMLPMGPEGKPMPPADRNDKADELPAPRAVPSAPAISYPAFGHGPIVPGPSKAPSELNRVLLPPYVIGVTDVLLIDSLKGLREQRPTGPHLVRPDGTVGLGMHGSARVAGLTIDQAKEEIARAIKSKLTEKVPYEEVLEGLSVDVLAYNSKVYYVITDGGGYGEQAYKFPYTGNETVLDALSLINGLPWNASKKHIWVARRVPGHGGGDNMLKVDWIGITQHGATATNYQILPGDRVYVRADRVRTFDANLAKILSPIERVLGVTLLGSQTVNSIKNGQVGGGGVR